LLHNRIGEIIWANLSPSHSMWALLAVELVVALVALAIMAAVV
jgi:hypothetical protein